MKTAGIIAEYNPFHNGHLYQIEQVRKQTGADYIVVVMSGDFVQRGEPAIFDKYTRTHMALASGADLVLELPVSFATSSAELFAQGAVSLFNQTGIIDFLCFGSESGSINELSSAANILVREPDEYTRHLRAFLKEGKSFPNARSLAMRAYLESQTSLSEVVPGLSAPSSLDRFSSIHASSALAPELPLSSPNDILGVEYLKALIRTESSIKPFTIRREGQHYNDETNPEVLNKRFPSASALRSLIREADLTAELLSKLSPWIPFSALDAMSKEDAVRTPIFADDFSLLLNSRLLELTRRQIPFERFADLSPELASRLYASMLTFDSYSGRIASLKSRQYTYTRISRALLHLLLGIDAEIMEERKKSGHLPYARILGFRKSASPLLSQLKAQSSVPSITKIAGADANLNETGKQMLSEELSASHLYQSVVFQKGRKMKNEYTRSLVILP